MTKDSNNLKKTIDDARFLILAIPQSDLKKDPWCTFPRVTNATIEPMDLSGESEIVHSSRSYLAERCGA
ncbi:hypothetical protein CEXT_218511 [Caerostris extrusa]|uniref:Uncharacterized protein n=1 Tax=Caerostris extrusa TaxID=172846 RepID=A0AAV4RC32_CAEEX|nr:hypothetical protein CEXT_218511 [Caerostris extrusa]